MSSPADLLAVLVSTMIFGAPGLLMLVIGLARYLRFGKIEDMTRTNIGTQPEGTVKITGSASAIDDTSLKKTPITGTESVIYELEVENRLSDSGWSPAYKERGDATFLVEDSTGTAIVDSADFQGLFLEDECQSVVEKRIEARPEMIEILEQHEKLAPEHFEWTKFRFTERVIEPEEQIHVIGEAKRPAGSSSGQPRAHVEVTCPDGLNKWTGPASAITDMSESDIVYQKQGTGLGLIGIGVIWTGLVAVFFWLPFIL